MKDSELKHKSLDNNGLPTTVVEHFEHTHCNSRSCYTFLLLQFILCLLIFGCASTKRHPPIIKSAPPTASRSIEATYTVQKGDTLYSIAQSHGIDYRDLAEWNSIENPGAINVGQQLSLSSPTQLAKPSIFALPESEPISTVKSTPEADPTLKEDITPTVVTLKTEPKALKLAYSEQAVSQLKESENALPVVMANTATEKHTEISSDPIPPSTETIHENSGIEWIWPTEGRISSHFSESTKGMDISGKTGQPVLASATGKVVYSGTGLRGYGQLIIIKHNSTYLSAYAHNSKLLVKEGQTVFQGQKIAEMGNTDSKLVRLHFEIRKNGKPVDPLKHLPETSG
ncbi:MAG: peptidoglycan DD-metalloendopeptidase family protein [Nitrosomonadaceae bacterium]